MIKGFKITNANFRQENVNLPKGIYTYGVTVRPVGTTLIFKVGAEIFTVPGLQAGVLTRVAHTFTTIQDATVFYPSITVGDQIFEPMLEVGTNASSPQANYLDDNDLVSEAGLKITNETAELYASKSYVNSSIIVSADNITSEVSNQINGLSTSITQTTNSISAKVNNIEEGLLDTGINLTNKQIILTADNTIFQSNNGMLNALFSGALTKITSEFIELEGLTTINEKFKVMLDGSIEATDATISGSVVAKDNLGNKISSMNSAGDGAYIQYYSSGRKKMEFNDGLILYYDDNEANSVLWQLGRSGSIISGSLDMWVSVMLVATNESGSNIKEQYITGVQWKVFRVGSSTSYPTYSGLTVNKDTALHSIPSNVPSSAYIPNGWYANAGDSGMIFDGGYFREIVYYQSGYKTNSTRIITF